MTRIDVKGPIQAIYDEADLKLERAQMDLLHPENAPHTLDDVKRVRIERAMESATKAFREAGHQIGTVFSQVAKNVTSIFDGFREAVNDGWNAGRDDYELRG